jgi:hypothetical protein
MKKSKKTSQKSFLLLLLSMTSFGVSAQDLSGLTQVFKAEKNDAGSLIRSYGIILGKPIKPWVSI